MVGETRLGLVWWFRVKAQRRRRLVRRSSFLKASQWNPVLLFFGVYPAARRLASWCCYVVPLLSDLL